MNFLIILLLALDLRIHAFNEPGLITDHLKDNGVEVLSDLWFDKCPRGIRHLCGTNGKDIMLFQNKCHLEGKNFELLGQGLQEYLECPLIFCQSDCPNCALINEPVCAVEVLTGAKNIFQNPCEVDKAMCTTKKVWVIVNIEECSTILEDTILSSLNQLLQHHECPEICPIEYRPVCARFMNLEREFANECELKDTNCRSQQVWHIIKHGPCPLSNINVDNKCTKICPLEQELICAKFHNEMRTFVNRCELDKIICQFGQDWQIVKEGHCLENRVDVQVQLCPEFCDNEYQPICAKFDREKKLFRNFCELQKERCINNINWEIVDKSFCLTSSNKLLPLAPKCFQICSKIYKPVCAKFQMTFKEFYNECELRKTICETNKAWTFFKNGHCPLKTDVHPTCPKTCSKDFSPLCASYNGQLKEFFNRCEMEKSSCETNTPWEFAKWGSCPRLALNTLTDSSECPQSCPAEYKPICAEFDSNLREFANKCEMQKIMCETKTNWQFFKNGRCPVKNKHKSACSHLCTKEFSPVCGRFNGVLREFFNNCELEKCSCETSENWELLNRGPCFESQFKRLARNGCENEIIKPICAIHEQTTKTFDNVCQMAMEIERSGNDWSILYKDRCTNATTSTIEKARNIEDYAKRETTANLSDTATTQRTFKAVEKLKKAENLSKETQTETTNNSRKINDSLKKERDEELYNNSKENYRGDDDGNDDYEESSSSVSTSKEDEDVYRQWVKAQTDTSHSSEIQSEENESYYRPFLEDALPKTKNYTFNYEGYSREDEASEEIYLQKNHRIDKSDTADRYFYNKENDFNIKKSSEDNAQRKAAASNKDLASNKKIKDSPELTTDQQNKQNLNHYKSKPFYREKYKINFKNKTENYNQNYKFIRNETLRDHEINNPSSSKTKKGEIYNGVVYKAPVYDAPTYNFIYTAPFNFPGFGLNYANHNTSSGNHTASKTVASLPFNPFHLFTSLAAMPGNGGSSFHSNLTTAGNGPTQVNSDLNLHSPSLHDGKLTSGFFNTPGQDTSLNAKSTIPLLTPAVQGKLNPTVIPPAAHLASLGQPYYSSSLTQHYTTSLAPPVLNIVNSGKNATLLIEILNTLRTLTKQV